MDGTDRPGRADTPGARMAAMYDASAPAYERYWAPALLRHSRDLLSSLPSTPQPRRVLEVATGTGALLPDLVTVAGAGGTVVAVDRSLGMLRRAGAGVPRVQADAAALPVRSRTVDVAVAAFVLFLVPDARAAVLELHRVLRPGGRMLAATWGEQRATHADVLLRDVLDRAGAPLPAPDPRSDDGTASPEAMRDLLLGAGLTDVRTEARPLDARFGPEDMIAMRTTCGTTGWRFAQLDEAAQRSVRSQLADRYAGLGPEAFTDTSEVLLTAARRAD
ncbi:MAG TPA: class I SAM-dependent methyltransferase [Nocardioides sp.]|nr:class I SAM-dependent methyltransferase [Nocardioides sp.]